jgi:nitric oxide reductase FlRd-NAD(+) reductase
MQIPIIIIGSGFAAYQLVKTVRRMDAHIPIQVFTAEDGAEYNKPDLSHVFSKKQTARDLVVKSGDAFTAEHNVELFANTMVDKVDVHTQYVTANGKTYPYAKLVFATGAKAFVPPMSGDAVSEVLTLNSLQEYQAAETQISRAKRVLVVGGGLIGVEIAMDLATSGKDVTIVEPNPRVLANLIPEFIALPLERQLKQQGIKLALDNRVVAVNRSENGLAVTLNCGRIVDSDIVVSAAGLCANTQLAKEATLEVNRGIVVDSGLQTSTRNVYALGDCAEIEGRMMPYLQPIVLSATVLGKRLLGQEAELVLPPMMVKVKTPSYPIQLAGKVNDVDLWEVGLSGFGIVAKAKDNNGQLVGFAVTNEQVKQAFPLLRELSQTMVQTSLS